MNPYDQATATASTPPAYSLAARLLHWLSAAAIFIAVPLAIAAENASLPEDRSLLFFWHKSFGILVLVIAAVRVLNRMFETTPSPHPGLPRTEKIAAGLSHYALYGLVLAVPLLGWLGTSAYGRPPSFFGLFTLPQLVAENRELGETVMAIHVVCAFTLAAIIAIHILAALYHGLRRDGVLGRMIYARPLPKD